MKRGSSVLLPPSAAAKRLTTDMHTHTHSHTYTHTRDDEHTQAAGSSPFPSATSLFSPDVSSKMASDLLIRLSEATQKAQVHPGSRAEAETQRREPLLEGPGGQQDEPGLALSPDGPGASPEPPSLTHTPEDNAAMDTLASDFLRKLAESRDMTSHGVRVKEEEEPLVIADPDRPITEDGTPPAPKMASQHFFSIKTEDQGLSGARPAGQFPPGAKMDNECLLGLKVEDMFLSGCCLHGPEATADSGAVMSQQAPFGTKMDDQFHFPAKTMERPFSGAKLFPGVDMEDPFPSGVKMENWVLSGTNMAEQSSSGLKTEEQLFFGAKVEDQVTSGATMVDQCLRVALWQDMSVNLASTLLHQLSERVGRCSSQQADSTTLPPPVPLPPPPLPLPPPSTSSPAPKVDGDPPSSARLRPPDPSHGCQSSTGRNQTPGFFYRCHVCGFETEGRPLFHNHMMEHREWERSSFTLHCCVCNHSTNQEAAMTVHTNTHANTGSTRCSATHPAPSSAPAVAMATLLEVSPTEHRCRICQRSFPGQQELMVHFQGHRQGNQYRCDRCGHLTRTANKLVEHVRVHTGERPFTCDLCPYSAKRRDSLRLHCKVKHPTHGKGGNAPGDVHTHRSYVHGDNQRAHKRVQRLHTNTHTSSRPPLPLPLCHGWRDLSPLIPITTLLSLRPRPPAGGGAAASSSSCKQSFLGYLGLTASI